MARHTLDLTSLVAGCAFVAVGLLSLLGDAADLAELIWPLLLGALGLAVALSGRRPRPVDRRPADEPDGDDPFADDALPADDRLDA